MWCTSRYLRENRTRNLQLGGGYHVLEDWLNGDVIAGDIYLDARKPFPFPDECFDLVFSEQFIEHLEFNDGRRCIEESYRILKGGGKIRLSTPDLRSLIGIYMNWSESVDRGMAMRRHAVIHNKSLTTPGHFLNDVFRLWGHSFIYDEETLRLHLENAGFSNISRHRFGESDRSSLAQLERHADTEWMKGTFHLILEAEKQV